MCDADAGECVVEDEQKRKYGGGGEKDGFFLSPDLFFAPSANLESNQDPEFKRQLPDSESKKYK